MKSFLFSTLCLGLVFSCSSDDNRNNNNTNNLILPVKIFNLDEESYIQYNNLKISEINENSGRKTIFQYEGDNITKVLTYDGKAQQDVIMVFTYNNGKIVSEMTTEIFNKGMINEKRNTYTLTYQWIDDNHVIRTGLLPSMPTSEIVDFYFSNGNLIKKIRTSNNGSFSYKYEYNYSYDNKYNPLKNITGMTFLLNNDYTMNNLIKKEELYTSSNTIGITSYVTTYSNEYNGSNYLTKQVSKTTITENGTSTSLKEKVKTYSYNR